MSQCVITIAMCGWDKGLSVCVIDVSSKAIDPTTLDGDHVMAMEVVCLVEETFLRTILMSQLYFIVHLVDEIALCGTIHAWWMFFLESFMKTLKGFVRQNASFKGSMVEGCG